MSKDQEPGGLQHVGLCARCPTAQALLRQVTLSCAGETYALPDGGGRIWWGEESPA